MKKIPTLFVRDPENMRRVTEELNPDLEWVDLGVPTEKIDGTCCLFRGGRLYKRYTLRRGKVAPKDFEAVTEEDPNTGKVEGWVPVGGGPEDKWHREALENRGGLSLEGTYELVGPKVQGNPYKVERHWLERHGANRLMEDEVGATFEEIRSYLEKTPIEGIVWWSAGSPVAKIKRKDFGLPWPA